jgi:Inositol polyphosphate kinase
LFRQDTGQFKYLDKYVGRSINAASFKQTLISYIDNGEKYLIGHIPGVLKKLKELYEAVLTMNTSRFYASSLLILYDGQNNPSKAADIKMIDFANCITSLDLVCNYPPSTNGPDGGYLLGLRTLISKFEEIYQEFAGDGKNLDAFGHILISNVSKVKRATAEIGSV